MSEIGSARDRVLARRGRARFGLAAHAGAVAAPARRRSPPSLRDRPRWSRRRRLPPLRELLPPVNRLGAAASGACMGAHGRHSAGCTTPHTSDEPASVHEPRTPTTSTPAPREPRREAASRCVRHAAAATTRSGTFDACSGTLRRGTRSIASSWGSTLRCSGGGRRTEAVAGYSPSAVWSRRKDLACSSGPSPGSGRDGRPLDELVIAGEGPLEAELRSLAERELPPTRVRFTGTVDATEVRALLETADVLATPCVIGADGDRDSMPVVVKEALAMEVPVVACRRGGATRDRSPTVGRSRSGRRRRRPGRRLGRRPRRAPHHNGPPMDVRGETW